MKYFIPFLFLLLAGCMYSLPEQIAIRCQQEVPGVCRHKAEAVRHALNACGYKGVRYCSGHVLPGDKRHAWTEFQEDGKIYVLDGAALLLDQILWNRSDLRKNEYIKIYETWERKSYE
jgi:hypothetical protein